MGRWLIYTTYLFRAHKMVEVFGELLELLLLFQSNLLFSSLNKELDLDNDSSLPQFDSLNMLALILEPLAQPRQHVEDIFSDLHDFVDIYDYKIHENTFATEEQSM